jgi:hypothetical protein
VRDAVIRKTCKSAENVRVVVKLSANLSTASSSSVNGITKQELLEEESNIY